MDATYRLIGSELSPYSLKLRSYLRYKQIPHEWVSRSQDNQEEFERLAKLPLIPLLVTPEGEGWQDSTPIIERLERLHPERSIDPEDPVLRAVSWLIEEYADEWGNKPMFHYRWWREVDQLSASERIARSMLGAQAYETPKAVLEELAQGVAARMVPRLRFVGSSAQTFATIEGSFERQLRLLVAHFESGRAYLFGGRPVLADFGWWAQLYQMWTDPTPHRLIREQAPSLIPWLERMVDPEPQGPLESWQALAPTIEPILATEIGRCFLPWSVANAKALADGSESLDVELEGARFHQQPQKYHARSLAALRQKIAEMTGRDLVLPVLERSGCWRWLAPEAPGTPP
jgi:glutathione S-transferase